MPDPISVECMHHLSPGTIVAVLTVMGAGAGFGLGRFFDFVYKRVILGEGHATKALKVSRVFLSFAAVFLLGAAGCLGTSIVLDTGSGCPPMVNQALFLFVLGAGLWGSLGVALAGAFTDPNGNGF